MKGAHGSNFKDTIQFFCNLIINESDFDKILDSTIVLFTKAKEEDMNEFIKPTIKLYIDKNSKD